MTKPSPSPMTPENTMPENTEEIVERSRRWFCERGDIAWENGYNTGYSEASCKSTNTPPAAPPEPVGPQLVVKKMPFGDRTDQGVWFVFDETDKINIGEGGRSHWPTKDQAEACAFRYLKNNIAALSQTKE